MSRSAEEWAKRCQNKRSGVLCLDCARAYARECVEAWREKAANATERWAKVLKEATKEHGREGVCKHGPGLDYYHHEAAEFAAALRAMPAETP